MPLYRRKRKRRPDIEKDAAVLSRRHQIKRRNIGAISIGEEEAEDKTRVNGGASSSTASATDTTSTTFRINSSSGSKMTSSTVTRTKTTHRATKLPNNARNQHSTDRKSTFIPPRTVTSLKPNNTPPLESVPPEQQQQQPKKRKRFIILGPRNGSSSGGGGGSKVTLPGSGAASGACSGEMESKNRVSGRATNQTTTTTPALIPSNNNTTVSSLLSTQNSSIPSPNNTPTTYSPFHPKRPLNQDQARVLNDNTGNHLFVSAGPGVGKTTLICAKVGQLFLNHLHSRVQRSSTREGIHYPLVVLSFSKKSVADLKERLSALNPALSDCVFTFHSFFSKYLSSQHRKLSISDARCTALFKEFIQDYCLEESVEGLKLRYADWRIKKALQNLHASNRDSAGKGSAKTPVLPSVALWENRLQSLHTRMADANLHDYTDILLHALEALKESRTTTHSSGARRPQRLSISHLLVDEFQDTSALQLELVKLISLNRVIAVGDSKQSIYEWRQARGEENIKEFIQHYQATRYSLNQNYRSNQHIVRLANVIMPSGLWSNNPPKSNCSIHLKRFEDLPQLKDYVLDRVAEDASRGKSVAVVARTRGILSRIKPRDSPMEPDNRSSNSTDGGGATSSITYLTLHASKGTEFDHVYIVDCNQGHLPHYLSLSEGNIEEERRLFYVGITRARQQLNLLGFDQDDRQKSLMPSEFLDPIMNLDFVTVDESMTDSGSSKKKSTVTANRGGRGHSEQRNATMRVAKSLLNRGGSDTNRKTSGSSSSNLASRGGTHQTTSHYTTQRKSLVTNKASFEHYGFISASALHQERCQNLKHQRV